jgi:phosphotransferase system IIB component
MSNEMNVGQSVACPTQLRWALHSFENVKQNTLKMTGPYLFEALCKNPEHES